MENDAGKSFPKQEQESLMKQPDPIPKTERAQAATTAPMDTESAEIPIEYEVPGELMEADVTQEEEDCTTELYENLQFHGISV